MVTDVIDIIINNKNAKGLTQIMGRKFLGYFTEDQMEEALADYSKVFRNESLVKFRFDGMDENSSNVLNYVLISEGGFEKKIKIFDNKKKSRLDILY